jgi:hypothetical protein
VAAEEELGIQNGAPIMPFSVAVMISVGTRGSDGLCGAEEEEEGLEEVGGGGEMLAGVLYGVGVVPALNGKTTYGVSKNVFFFPSLHVA